VASILFTLERKGLIQVPRALLFFVVCAFFAYVKIMSLFVKGFDPFVPFENLTSAVFLGGLSDAFKKAAQKPSAAAKSKEAGSELNKLASGDLEAKKSN
jgi:hypothetical protein